jgi:hypothetical protein
MQHNIWSAATFLTIYINQYHDAKIKVGDVTREGVFKNNPDFRDVHNLMDLAFLKLLLADNCKIVQEIEYFENKKLVRGFKDINNLEDFVLLTNKINISNAPTLESPKGLNLSILLDPNPNSTDNDNAITFRSSLFFVFLSYKYRVQKMINTDFDLKRACKKYLFEVDGCDLQSIGRLEQELFSKFLLD